MYKFLWSFLKKNSEILIRASFPEQRVKFIQRIKLISYRESPVSLFFYIREKEIF